VTRGWLPQRAGLPGLNGDGAAASIFTAQCTMWFSTKCQSFSCNFTL